MLISKYDKSLTLSCIMLKNGKTCFKVLDVQSFLSIFEQFSTCMKEIRDNSKLFARNAIYLSKTAQNDLLSCIKELLQPEIANDI